MRNRTIKLSESGNSRIGRVIVALVLSMVCTTSWAQFDYEFWMPPLWMVNNSTTNQPSELFITTPYPTPVDVHIETPDGTTFVFDGTVVSGTPLTIPLTTILGQTQTYNQVITNNGLIVNSSAPIQCIHKVASSNNQSLVTLKGRNGLGRTFWCGSQIRNLSSTYFPLERHFISVMATENNTQVTFQTPSAMDLDGAGDLPNPFTVTLNRHECYLIRTNTSAQTVSGALVTSNKDIVVTSGSTHTRISSPLGSAADAGTDQLVPIELTGTQYAVIKGNNSFPDDYAIVVATENGTQVFIDGGNVPVATLNAGQIYDYTLTGSFGSPHSIRTSKRSYVYHVSGVSLRDEVDMSIMPQLQCTGSRYIEFSRFTLNTDQQVLTILAAPGSLSTLRLNNVLYSAVPGVIVNSVPGLTGWTSVVFPNNATAADNIIRSEGFFHAGWLTGSFATGAYGYLSGFDDAFEFQDPESFLPTNIYSLRRLCQGQSLDHCVRVFSCGGDHEIVNVEGALGTVVVAPPSAPSDSCFRYTAPTDFVGRDTVTFTIRNSLGFQGLLNIVFTIVNPDTPIDAGSNQTICTVSQTTIAAVNPDPWAIGYWTVAQGTGILATPNSPTSLVTNLSLGANSFIWHQSYPWCSEENVDIVQVFRFSGTPPAANAGPDASICTNSYTMAANNPGVTGIGTWEILSGNATISNINSATASVTNIGFGVNTFRWNIGNGACPGGETSDVMVINVFNPNHPASNAGPDQTACQGSFTNLTLTALTPPQSPATGTWTVVAGSGTLANANQTTTTVSGLAIGINTFRYTINNGPCGNLIDEVSIVVFSPASPAANAGPDQSVCAPGNSATLAGNTPIFPATGLWTVVSGTGTFANSTLSNTTVSGLSIGPNVFRWRLSNGPCANPITQDEVTITLFPVSQPAVNAGPDQQLCFNPALPLSATMSGSAVTSPGTGQWTVISGSGTFTPSNSPTAVVTGMSVGANVYRWTVSNGPCNPGGIAPSDEVTVTIFNTNHPGANAGSDAVKCLPNNTHTMNATAAISPATGFWSLVSGSGTVTTPTSPTSGVTNLGVGVNTFRWTIQNGPCGTANFDEMSITVFSNASPLANAGPDLEYCFNPAVQTVATMAGNAPIAPATGVWTLVSGAGGTVVAPNSPTTNINNLPVGTHVYQWTINNGVCGTSFDQVSIRVFNPNQTGANAGADQTICSTTTTINLSANALLSPATGQWTVVSGTGNFGNATLPSTTVTGMSVGQNVYRWTLNNGPCAAPAVRTDDVVITVFNSSQQAANAGVDQNVCSTTSIVNLSGTVPIFPATGSWTLINGAGIFSDPTSPVTSVSGLSIGTNTFQYTINNGPCGTPTTDQVVITVSDVGAPVANAGPDQSLCLPITSATLAGNIPLFPATGVWTVVSGTGTVVTPSSATSTVTGLSVGENIFRWTVNNGACGTITNDVVSIFVFNLTQAPANAGSDFSICTPQSTYTMQANSVISPAVGTWTLVAGTGTISDVNSPVANISGLGVGQNVFRWTISNGPCGSNFDEMSIFVYDENQPVANAGVDQSLCRIGSTPIGTTLTGSPVIFPGSGVWSIVQGTGSISNATLSTATVNNLGVGENIFRWTVSNGTCNPNSSFDEVSVFVFPSTQPPANAGTDQSLCSTTPSTVLNANTPVLPGTGSWSVVQGTATFTNANSPNTTVSGLATGVNILRWTISNGPCIPSTTFDDVVITVFNATQAPANAGADFQICSSETSITLSGNSIFAPATATWQLVSGTGVFDTPNASTTTVTGLSLGANTFRYSINNGGCGAPTTDLITVTVFSASQGISNAGPDQSICSPQSTVTLTGTSLIAPATGQWTLVSGSGTITSPTLSATTVTALPVGTHVFQYTVSNGPCTPSITTDQVTIQVFSAGQAAANAGPDQSFCEPVSSTTFAGNSVISPATGVWTLVSGTGTILTPNSPTSQVTGLTVGQNIFRWTISNGPCSPSSSFDEVSIFIFDDNQLPANAGPDQVLCTPTSATTMAGSAVIFPAFGTWQLVSGTGNIITPGSPTTLITGLSVGENIFRWTVNNGPCAGGTTQDLVSIFVFNSGAPAANAGPDQSICTPASSVTMAANSSIFPGTGVWTLVSGSGTITNPASATTTITGLAVGENVFRWTINNGGCGLGTTSDVVSIFVYSQSSPNANAGPDQNLCTPITSTTMAGSLPIFPGNGIWSLVSGSGTINTPTSPTTSITGLAIGPNVFRWTVFNGPCANGTTTDEVTITLFNGGASAPDAGVDRELCSPTSTVTMSAVAAEFPGVGTWTLISGGGTITSPNNPVTTITGLPIGVNVFRWTLNYATCGNQSDDVSIIVYNSAQGAANAGPDQELCNSVSSTVMAAQPVLTPGIGTWSRISGTGDIINVNSPTTSITNLAVGENVFVWTVYNGPCLAVPLRTDTVRIWMYDEDQTPANAGSDLSFCTPTSSANLVANPLIFPATGQWIVVSGSGSITAPTLSSTTITGLTVGQTVVRWTVDNGPCPSSITSDELTILIYDQTEPPANAGPDQLLCSTTTTTTLSGSLIIFPAVGTWTVLSGTAVVTNPNNRNSGVTNLTVGEHQLQWTVFNGPCGPVTTDVMSIFIFDSATPVANAGPDQELCVPNTSTTLSGSSYVFPTTGTWTIVQGSVTFANINDPNTTITDIAVGNNILRWTVNNGPCPTGITSDDVSIRMYIESPPSNAGVDQEFCSPTSTATLNATPAPVPGFGTWSVVSGTAVVTQPNNPNSPVTGLTIGESVLAWTVYNGPCLTTNTVDQVSLFVFDASQNNATAGADQFICTPQTSTTMAANSVTFPAIGTWTLISGSGTITTPNSPTTLVTDLALGTNVLRWTIDNGPCTNGISFDEVVINVFANDLDPSNAGDDQEICLPQTTTTLEGSELIGAATGEWTVVSGSVVFADNSDPLTAITSIAQGSNVLVWTVDNGSCGLTSDTVLVELFNPGAPEAFAGDDVSFCTPVSTYIMQGNAPEIPGVGTWTLIGGTATIEDVNDPNTNVSGLTIGENILVWTIYNGDCDDITSDTVSVSIFDENMLDADAGIDQEICLPQNSTLMTALPAIFPATGLWTLVSGGGTIVDPTSAITLIADLPQGENIFRWTTDNGPCADAITFDEVIISVFPANPQTVNAGPDQGWCEPVSSTIMVAQPLQSPSFGTWSLVNGTGDIQNVNSPNSPITDLTVGANDFLWTVYQGPCLPAQTDLVTIFIYPDEQGEADAGADIEECTPNTTVQLSGNSITFPATGIWTLVEGAGTIENEADPATVVTDLEPGVNVFVWMVDNGECDNALTTDTMTVSIFIDELLEADAGADQELCFPINSTTLVGSEIAGAATGTWTLLSGGGTIVQPDSSSTEIIDMPIGINVFTWFVDNGPCGNSIDTVMVAVFNPDQSLVDAGLDGSYCTPTSEHVMAASIPNAPAIGTWIRLTGVGVTSDVNDPNATISGLTVGENIYIWSVDNGACAEPVQDVMSIFIYNETTPDAFAGEDQELCLVVGETVTSATMNASAAEFPAIGTWSVIQGNGIIGDFNSPTATMSNLEFGVHLFVWTVDNGPCPNGITTDTVRVDVFDPSIPNPISGPDQFICTPLTEVVMAGSSVQEPNFGIWTLSSGSASIEDENNPNTIISQLAVGVNCFTWSIYNGQCENSLPSDSMCVFVFDENQEDADAGEDQELCFPETFTVLNGNALIVPATGLWTVVSGTATFADATNPTTSVSDLSIGENMLVWTIFNGPCDNAVTSDTLLIEVFDPEQTTVDAGLDQEYCVPISCATMNGSVPASPQVGTWSVISAVNGSGPVSFGSFNNVNNPQAEICGLVVGLHTLQWEIYNGPCSNDSRDTVTVSIFDNNAPAANAGPDQRLCDNGSSTNLQGNAAVFPAVGTWTVLSSPGIPQISNVNDSLALVTGLDIGITELIWTIYNGPCNELTADTVRIAVYNPATPNAAAGADQNFCEDLPDVLLSASNVLPPAIGTWTIISGGGTLVNANDPNTTLEDVPLNENILVWTVDNGACVPGITSDTLSIYVNDLSVAAANAGEDLFFCGAPDSTQLNGSVTVGLAESTWNVLSGGGDIDNSENNNPYVFNLPTGTNTFSYTVDNGECGITTDTLQITVYDPNLEPAFAGINASICASEFGQFNLQGNAVQSPAFGFWQVIDGPAEVLDSLDAETPVTTLGEILIELQGVPSTLVYTIDNGLCGITTDTVVYVLEDCLTIEIPDAFSPNADGVNDTWTIPNIASYPNNSLKIFNRWGAEVYSAAPYENEWAGISIHPATVGSELPVSTYYYILDLGEDGEVLNGFVYLKR